ncbi:MAG: CrcB family protein [Candidatus Nanopelagicaceae bacterium]|nr:CrcB family protein [Candidatus Nanopelagicaceae bacterium]
MKLALFLIGAGVGAPTRYVIDRFFRDSYRFPYGILIVNVVGSFLLGVIANQETDLAFLLFGFCGALTTWSAFALDLFNERGDKKLFAVNLFGNYLLGVFAALLGLWISR